MSLIGIDVGTSAVKVGVYAEDGLRLAHSTEPVAIALTEPGRVELDPQLVWEAVKLTIARVVSADPVCKDSPRALAISASGDEVFPVDRNFAPLGPCIMSADMRGGDIEATTLAHDSVPGWYARCGHAPERMDPVNRILWWRTEQPSIFDLTARFLGWHEFLTYKLCGRPTTDPSLASKWLVYDLATGQWSGSRLEAFAIASHLLPEIQNWGEQVGVISPALASELGLPKEVIVGVGGFDSVCTALGLGVSAPGAAGLACGTWETLVAPMRCRGLDGGILAARMPVVAYPGETCRALLWQSPNGASVARWAARLIGQPLPSAEVALESLGCASDPVFAIPHLSGAVGIWPNGRHSRGAIWGMTPSTTGSEIFRAFLEGVAFDLAAAVRLMESAGVPVETLRAGGGGTRSPLWMQLKADVTGKPIEVCAHPDSGALGAAILAGTSLGIYNSPEQTASRLVRIVRRFDPSPGRTAEYSERLRAYTAAVPKMMEISTASRCKREPRGRVEVITPALVVDLDVFEANVAAAEQMLPASGKMLRPHFKTHRTCALAMRQLGPRAPGFTCATVDEAEALVQAGAWDILLANEVVTASKIERLAVLAKHARVIVAVDDREPMLALAREARRQGTIAEVVIDIDIGLHRCGVRTLTAARDLAGAAAAEPGLRFAGIMGYEGRLRADVTDRAGRIAEGFARLAAAKAEIEQSGLKVEMVSAGGTSTLCEALQDPHITEIQAGTYALMEPDLDPLGLPFRGAVRVLGSVISRNGAQVVVDVGRRTVGCDSGLPIALVPGATTIRVNDEHTVLTWPGELPPLGTQVSLRPSQNRTTFNLHEVVWLARNGQVAESTPISAC